MKLGAHISIADGLHLSFFRGRDIGCETMQIFTKNATRWQERIVSDEEAEFFRRAQEETGIRPVVAHDSYLINLASIDESKLQKSKKAFIGELERAEKLGLTNLVTHPGSHGGAGEEEGIKKFAENVNLIHEQTSGFKVKITFETTAGQGNSLGHRFDHIAEIFRLINDTDRCAVCLDTAHIFAAGYDIREKAGLDGTLREFDRLIGLHRLEVIHVNDSKKELSSRVDRHENIGEGYIGLEAFRYLLHHDALRDMIFILETPMKNGGHTKNLKTLKGLIDG